MQRIIGQSTLFVNTRCSTSTFHTFGIGVSQKVKMPILMPINSDVTAKQQQLTKDCLFNYSTRIALKQILNPGQLKDQFGRTLTEVGDSTSSSEELEDIARNVCICVMTFSEVQSKTDLSALFAPS